MEKKNLEKIYEKFLEEIKPTEEMRETYDEIANKFQQIKDELSDEQINDLDDLEDLISKANALEMKEAFYKGFSVATNLILESKD